MKKQSNLSRLMGYAGGHKILTYLSWVLSVMSALLALVPFWYIWRIIHDILEACRERKCFSNFLPPAGGQTLRGSFYILSNGCSIFRTVIAFAFKIVLGAVRHFGLHPSDI